MMFFAIQQMNTMKKSNLNFEQTTLQMKKLAIQDQISEIQQRNDNLASAFSSITSGVAMQAGSIFNETINNASLKVSNAQAAFEQAKKSGLGEEALKIFEEQLTLAKDESKTVQQKAYVEYQRQNTLVASLTKAYKNVKEAEEKAELKRLNEEEIKIEMRLNEISTQMTMIDKELESAAQASEQTSQKLAPKYVA